MMYFVVIILKRY